MVQKIMIETQENGLKVNYIKFLISKLVWYLFGFGDSVRLTNRPDFGHFYLPKFFYPVLLSSFSVTALWWMPHCNHSLFLSWPVYT